MIQADKNSSCGIELRFKYQFDSEPVVGIDRLRNLVADCEVARDDSRFGVHLQSLNDSTGLMISVRRPVDVQYMKHDIGSKQRLGTVDQLVDQMNEVDTIISESAPALGRSLDVIYEPKSKFFGSLCLPCMDWGRDNSGYDLDIIKVARIQEIGSAYPDIHKLTIDEINPKINMYGSYRIIKKRVITAGKQINVESVWDEKPWWNRNSKIVLIPLQQESESSFDVNAWSREYVESYGNSLSINGNVLQKSIPKMKLYWSINRSVSTDENYVLHLDAGLVQILNRHQAEFIASFGKP